VLSFAPRRWRVTLEWLVTLAFAVAVVFITKVEVANAYVIPSASMEPTLHCARGGDDCRGGRFSDRVLANRFVYRIRDPNDGRSSFFGFLAPPVADGRERPS